MRLKKALSDVTMTKVRKSYKQWTKDDLRQFLTLWEEKTAQELADYFDTSSGYISHIAKKFREEGYDLPLKKTRGTVSLLIREIVAEAKGPKRR
jgi:transposase